MRSGRRAWRPSRCAARSRGTPGVVAPGDRCGLAGAADRGLGRDPARPDELSAGSGCHARADNEVHLAVVGERWRGAAHELEYAVYLQLGIGVAAGIVVRGQLFRGAAGGAGEIGYLPVRGVGAAGRLRRGVRVDRRRAGFARAGRAAARRPGVLRLLELAGGRGDAINAQVVFAAAGEGDRAAIGVVDELADRIAHGVAALACVLNPGVVVVGGGLSNAGPALLEPLDGAWSGSCRLPPTRPVRPWRGGRRPRRRPPRAGGRPSGPRPSPRDLEKTRCPTSPTTSRRSSRSATSKACERVRAIRRDRLDRTPQQGLPDRGHRRPGEFYSRFASDIVEAHPDGARGGQESSSRSCPSARCRSTRSRRR